jgi:hypothetical protein
LNGNGVRAAGWYWDGGVTIAFSFNVEIHGSRLSGNYNGDHRHPAGPSRLDAAGPSA